MKLELKYIGYLQIHIEKKKSVLENLQLKLTRLEKQTSKKPWTTTITTKPKQKPQPNQQKQNTKQKNTNKK